VSLAAFKWLVAALPDSWQHELRRHHFGRQIRGARFNTDEKEYALLDTFLREGDWALDIGANVGQYTMRMGELVGASGRVIALEPVPDTFSLLAANTRLFTHANVSLLNAAASDRLGVASMQIPRFASGLSNYYQAHLGAGPGVAVLTLSIDELSLPRVRLVKMDVEGHELPALRGMRRLLARDHPVLIIETGSQETMAFLGDLGYAYERLPGSSNLLCRPRVEGQR
jgi:FkbM family methyltransferase